ncbi:MAG: restriction endonuclease subunit S [Anaerolineales bacterium]|nr:restriction endonuclease subunit S [Anaerolineales bacterium]
MGRALNFDERLAPYQQNLFYVGLANVESNTSFFVETEEQEPEGTCRLFKQGDVLYGKLRPYLNKVYVASQDGQCSTEFYALSSNEPDKLDHSFLAAFLMSKPFLSQTIHMMTGNTHPRIQREDFEEILIPLPSFDTQRALVAEMESARAARQAKLSQAEELLGGIDEFVLNELEINLPKENKQPIFALKFGKMGKSRIDPSFHHPDFGRMIESLQPVQVERLGNVVEFSSEIWKPADEKKPTFRYIEISAIDTQTGEASAEEMFVSEAPSRARMVVKQGDILVSLTRPHRGAIALLDKDFDNCIASTGFAVLRKIKRDGVLPEYLWAILRNPVCLRQMLQRSSGGNYPAITEEELRQIIVPIPNLATQKKVVSEFHSRQTQARALRAEAEREWQSAKEKFEKTLLGE